MKKVLSNLIVPVVMFVAVLSCQDPNNLLGDLPTTSVPPVIDKVTPDSRVKIGTEFDITVELTDGEKSPLASVSGTLYYVKKGGGSIDTVMLSELASQTVSGTSDSTGWAGSSFKAATLDTGDYVIHIEALDNANNLTTGDFGFAVFDLPFAANYPTMYMLGAFNGWGGAPADRADWKMELVAPHTWQLKDKTISGAWKFSVNSDFDSTDPTNEDWGDTNCDGVMEPKSGPNGNGDTNCGYDGDYDITFNDETFNYTMQSLVTFEQVLTDLYLVGNFNDFEGSDDYKFVLDSNNTWVLKDVILKGGEYFRFSEGADLSGKIYGAGTDVSDSTAVKNGANIFMPDAAKRAYYNVIFNDKTLMFSVRYSRSINLYIVGAACVAGWDETKAFQMEPTGEKQYRTYQYLSAGGDGFQFLPERGSWSGQIGKGSSDGSLTTSGAGNLSVDTEGFYRIDVDLSAMTYTITESSWGIVGDGANGWPSDTNPTDIVMTLTSATKGNFSFTASGVELKDGAIKFRENKAWTINYGDTGADGTLDKDGDNISSTAGTYDITITLDSENGYTYEIK